MKFTDQIFYPNHIFLKKTIISLNKVYYMTQILFYRVNCKIKMKQKAKMHVKHHNIILKCSKNFMPQTFHKILWKILPNFRLHILEIKSRHKKFLHYNKIPRLKQIKDSFIVSSMVAIPPLKNSPPPLDYQTLPFLILKKKWPFLSKTVNFW